MTKSTSNINSLEDIRGKRAGVELGTIAKAIIQARFSDAVNIIEYTTAQDVLQALADDKVDVIFLASDSAQYWVSNNNEYKLIDNAINDGSGYGIMANKKNADLINRINEALNSMENDGSYLKLYTRYFSHISS